MNLRYAGSNSTQCRMGTSGMTLFMRWPVRSWRRRRAHRGQKFRLHDGAIVALYGQDGHTMVALPNADSVQVRNSLMARSTTQGTGLRSALRISSQIGMYSAR